MSAFPGVWALRLSASSNGWMESIRIFSAGITVSTLKISGIVAKRSTRSIVNMIWQDWILSCCRKHKAKESLHMLSVMSSTRCSACLLYTSDAADDLLCVDLGGRRIIKKKKKKKK